MRAPRGAGHSARRVPAARGVPGQAAIETGPQADGLSGTARIRAGVAGVDEAIHRCGARGFPTCRGQALADAPVGATVASDGRGGHAAEHPRRSLAPRAGHAWFP